MHISPLLLPTAFCRVTGMREYHTLTCSVGTHAHCAVSLLMLARSMASTNFDLAVYVMDI